MRFRSRHLVMFGLTCAMFICYLSSPVSAKVVIEPFVSASWQMDSNYFKAETNEREVYTYTIQPGIRLGLESDKSLLNFNYSFDAHYYEDKGGAVLTGQPSADEGDFFGHTAVLQARYKLFRRLTLALDDSFYNTRDPGQSDALSNATTRDKYSTNRLSPGLFYDFGSKFSTGLQYRNIITDYSPAGNEDSLEHAGIFDLIYNFNRTLSLDLQYEHAQMNYDLTTSDYESNQVKLILKKEFRLLGLEIGGGYHNRTFDNQTISDIERFVYHINIDAKESLLFARHVKIYYDANFNDQGLGDAYYLAHRVTLSITHDFTKKLHGNLGGYYQLSDYETSDRDDNTYNVSGGISVDVLRWLRFAVSAGYEKRDSNQTGLDYDNTFFMVNLRTAYDFGKK